MDTLQLGKGRRRSLKSFSTPLNSLKIPATWKLGKIMSISWLDLPVLLHRIFNDLHFLFARTKTNSLKEEDWGFCKPIVDNTESCFHVSAYITPPSKLNR